MKYKSEYDPSKRPRKSSLRSGNLPQISGIDLGSGVNWGNQLNSPNSNFGLKKNSFNMIPNFSDKKQSSSNIKWIDSYPNSKVRSSGKTNGGLSRRVSFQDKPKVFHVENWKILNVDMSKEGKLYSRFNRGNSGKAQEDNCRVF
jgi:hypothetical protein